MPIATHEEIGRLLKVVYDGTYSRRGAHNRVDSVRSTLDDWLQREYNHKELPNERFYNMYYGDRGTIISRKVTATERQSHLDNINRVSELLTKNYPDCLPIRSLKRNLELARQSIEGWKIGKS